MDLDRLFSSLDEAEQIRHSKAVLAQRASDHDPHAGFYQGRDPVFGLPLVKGETGVGRSQLHTNVQPSLGQVGVNTGGFNVGNRRSQQERRRKLSPASGDCLLPGLLVYQVTNLNNYSTVYTDTSYLNGIGGTVNSTKLEVFGSVSTQKIIWYANSGNKVTLFLENVPAPYYGFYIGSQGPNPDIIDFFPDPYLIIDVIFWAESKETGEVCVVLTKDKISYTFKTFRLTEYGATELASTIKTYPIDTPRLDTYVGNSTIEVIAPYPSPQRINNLKSNPYIDLVRLVESSIQYAAVRNGSTFPLEKVDLNNNPTKIDRTVFFSNLTNVYLFNNQTTPDYNVLCLPILFNDVLFNFELIFEAPIRPFNSGFNVLLSNNKICAIVKAEVFTKKSSSYQKNEPPTTFVPPYPLNISNLGTFNPEYIESNQEPEGTTQEYFYIPTNIDFNQVFSNEGFENRIYIWGSYFYPGNDCKIKNSSSLTTGELGKFYIDPDPEQ